MYTMDKDLVFVCCMLLSSFLFFAQHAYSVPCYFFFKMLSSIFHSINFLKNCLFVRFTVATKQLEETVLRFMDSDYYYTTCAQQELSQLFIKLVFSRVHVTRSLVS
jgi:hypothetical protein